jgi:hypothetical protein
MASLTIRGLCYIITVLVVICYVYLAQGGYGNHYADEKICTQLDAGHLLAQWDDKIAAGYVTAGRKIFRDNFTDTQFKDLGSG